MRISDWSSDGCSSDLRPAFRSGPSMMASLAPPRSSAPCGVKPTRRGGIGWDGREVWRDKRAASRLVEKGHKSAGNSYGSQLLGHMTANIMKKIQRLDRKSTRLNTSQ